MKFTHHQWRPRYIRLVPTKEKLTDSTGLGTLVEIFDRSKFSGEFKKCLPTRVHASSHGSYRLGLIQLSSFLYGHDCLDDLREFQQDPNLSVVMKGETVAPRTMGDFLRDFEEEHIEALNRFLAKMAFSIRRHMEKTLPEAYQPEVFQASIDSTAHEQSGKQMEGVALNYEQKWCLDSQVIFDEMGLCYGFELRSGNTYSSQNAEALIEQTFSGFNFRDEKYLSGDSAYCEQGVIRYCLLKGIKFTFTAHDQRTGWRERVSEVEDWHSWDYSAEQKRWYSERGLSLPIRELGRLHWRPSWAENIVLNIIVKREWKTLEGQAGLFDKDSGGGFWHYYAIVTNISLFYNTKQSVVERHNKRGNAENFIREEQYGYDLKHFPCLKLRANYAFGLLAMVAHNLLRWIAIVEKPDKPHYSKKLRRRFVFIPGKVIEHARQVILKVPVQFFKEVNRLRSAWQLPLHPAPALGYG